MRDLTLILCHEHLRCYRVGLRLFSHKKYLLLILFAMDFEAISAAPWWAKKCSFTSLVTANITEVSRFLRKRTNTSPPVLMPIGGDALPPLITWEMGWSGLNLPRSASVRGSSPLFFDHVIDQLIR